MLLSYTEPRTDSQGGVRVAYGPLIGRWSAPRTISGPGGSPSKRLRVRAPVAPTDCAPPLSLGATSKRVRRGLPIASGDAEVVAERFADDRGGGFVVALGAGAQRVTEIGIETDRFDAGGC